MTNHSSHATLDRLKQLASAPTAPNAVGNIWREHGTPKRYRKGGNGGTAIIEPTCPSKGPQGTSGGNALRMPSDPVFA